MLQGTVSIRLFGGGLIACAIAWRGLCEAQKLQYRVEFLKAISAELHTLKTEMEFGKYELGYIFKKLKLKNDRNFFEICHSEMENLGIKNAWAKAVSEITEHGFLKDNDADIILQLGNSLGMSDIEGQKNNIDMTLSELRKNITVAEEEYVRLSKVYRGCGVLLGIFIMIILA